MRRDFKDGDASVFWQKAVAAHNTAISNLQNGDTDAAVNRAYYAMRHAATALLLAADAAPPGHRHGTLIGALGKFVFENHPEHKHIGELFHLAQAVRNTADYASSFVEDATANDVVEWASEFLNVLEHEIFPDLDAFKSNDADEGRSLDM